MNIWVILFLSFQNCEDGIIHSVFRRDNRGSWGYADQEDEADSFDDDFDHQSENYRASRLGYIDQKQLFCFTYT